MVMKAFIIHGVYGNSNENWFPWLKQELESIGFEVFIPNFPTPENQNLTAWFEIFKDYEKEIDSDTIFIGHSLGPAFILNVLENIDIQINSCFLVAGFTGKLNDPQFNEINRTFAEREFNWDKIRENCKKFFVFYSDNDPYVPSEKARDLVKNLKAEAYLIKGAGHFNKASGYETFPVLLEKIKDVTGNESN